MDAKVGDWVVTPRRGKAVEINALWYNALRLLAGWLREEEQATRAAEIDEHADRALRSFNERFWCDERGWLYDVVDAEGPDDASLRPNQLLAISLDHAVLAEKRWRPVVDVVAAQLLTPMGLRTLARTIREYQPHYDGDLRARDAAYHQGTVWPWLIGPYIDALAEGLSARARAGEAVAVGVFAALRRGLHRHDQRDFRRRGALSPRAAALRRPGAWRKCCAVDQDHAGQQSTDGGLSVMHGEHRAGHLGSTA